MRSWHRWRPTSVPWTFAASVRSCIYHPPSHRQAFEFSRRPHLTVDPAIDVVHPPLRVVLVLDEETQAVRPTVLTGNVDNFVGRHIWLR
jgi:hypothetical protein